MNKKEAVIEVAPDPRARETASLARKAKNVLKRRKAACRKLGIVETERLLYSAQAAADALGISVGMVRKHIKPDDYAQNPYYRYAGAPVGLYDPISLVKASRRKVIVEACERYARRSAAAAKAVQTRENNMIDEMVAAEITIVPGKTTEQILSLARATHGGNYRGDPGEFYWTNRTARNCIRHNLTNYEELWGICNRGETGRAAYEILRTRVDLLIAETYPQFIGDEDAQP